MKLAPPLLLFACAALASPTRAEDPGQVNAGQQASNLAPGAANSDTRLSPANPSNQLPFTRADSVQDKQFPTPDEVQKQMASFADKQAPIDVTETKEKSMIDRKDFPQPKTIDRKMSPDDGQMFHDQPDGDMLKKYGMVQKYQDSLDNASQVFGKQKVIFSKTTSFDKLNKFAFLRNGPGTGDALVTSAGGGSPAQISGGSQKKLPAPLPPAGPVPTTPSTAPTMQ